MKIYIEGIAYDLNVEALIEEMAQDGLSLHSVSRVGEVVSDTLVNGMIYREVYQLNFSGNGSLYTMDDWTLEFVRVVATFDALTGKEITND